MPDYQAIYQVYLEENSTRKAAARLQIGEGIVRRAMLECGHPPAANKQKHSDEVVIEAWQRIGSCEGAAEELKIGRMTVWRVLKRHKLNPGSGKCRPGEKTRRVALPMEEVIDRYNSGETMDEIAQDYEVDKTTIQRHLKKAGHTLTRRPPAGEHHSNWQGGKEYLHRPEPPRRVVREYLGEPLPRGWIVHHLDECPPNNAPDNLWIFASHADHTRCHRRLTKLRAQGSPVLPIQMALEIGGQWLPRLRALRQAEPEKDLLSLLQMPSTPWLDLTAFELEMDD